MLIIGVKDHDRNEREAVVHIGDTTILIISEKIVADD